VCVRVCVCVCVCVYVWCIYMIYIHTYIIVMCALAMNNCRNYPEEGKSLQMLLEAFPHFVPITSGSAA
jgi:hypothetical protein